MNAAEDPHQLEVSVVMPCLNEAETLARCIRKAQRSIAKYATSGEVVVADNGSTDGSQQIAEDLGARVVEVSAKGYGHAVRGGVEAAHGHFIIMGDSDDSYDFSAIHPFVEKLREGYDLVMGSRFKGRIMPGAMPWKHRWIGNPVLTAIGRLFFRCPLSDFHCGLRGFSKGAYHRMGLVTTGMEFASEMAIKACLGGLRVTEVPVSLYPDGRSRPPHLRSWRDGWRHLRFMLLHSPGWLFILPGCVSMALALLGFGLLLPGPKFLGHVVFDVQTLVICATAWLLGFQLVSFGVTARAFAAEEGLLPSPRWLVWLREKPVLEYALVIGLLAGIGGTGFIALASGKWYAQGLGPLDYSQTMRLVVPGVVLVTSGMQVIAGSFFLSVMHLGRTRDHSRHNGTG